MSDPHTNAPESAAAAQQPTTELPPQPVAQAEAAPHSAGAQPVGAPLPTQPAQAPKPAKEGGLSTFLKVSIILLAALTVASISLVFIGDFDGKFERVFSTFVLFAVFVTLTALDTRRGQKSEWYAPVALIANAYILGLLLIVIWMTSYDPFSLMWEIFWKSLFVIVVTRVVILCCQLLLKIGEKLPEIVNKFAFVTSVLAVLSGVLFTAPVGLEAFDLDIPDLYWKIATALLILTALGLSITLLLRWSYGADARAAARERSREEQAMRVAAQQQAIQGQQAQQAYYAQQAAIAQQAQQQMYAEQAAAAAAASHVALQPQQVASQPSQPVQPAQPVAAEPQPELLPWPTFADGSPLPAGPDGQPDFSVPGAPRP